MIQLLVLWRVILIEATETSDPIQGGLDTFRTALGWGW